ncbi:MAG: preprotein translocase subunit YajC [Alphaproteobacteria bacterium]|nr:preprotein translocase subunit YajC [Alphaproteobacteria bacterium]
MFISPAFAAETAATASGTSMVVQLILIMVVFYIFLIRPQQKKMKQHEQLLQSIKKGDKIITGGGIVAKVIDASDPFELLVEIASGVEVKVYRATVRDVVAEDVKPVKTQLKTAKAVAKKPANANKKTKK